MPLTDDENVLTTAMQALYLNVLNSGREIIRGNNEFLDSFMGSMRKFIDELDRIRVQTNDERSRLHTEHMDMLKASESRLNTLLKEGSEQSISDLRQDVTKILGEMASTISALIVRVASEGLAIPLAETSETLRRMAKDQTAVTVAFNARVKELEGSLTRSCERLDATSTRNVQKVDSSITRLETAIASAKQNVSYSWAKRIITISISVLFAVGVGLVVSKWALYGSLGAPMGMLERTVDEARFVEALWPKLSQEEQTKLNKLAGDH